METNNEKLVECASDDDWDQFILGSCECNVFSLSSFLHALGIRFSRYFLYMKGDIAASVLLIDPDNPNFIAPCAYSLYQGISYSKSSAKGSSRISEKLQITQLILNCLNRLYPYHSLCLHHSTDDLRAFQWYNYNEPEHHKYQFKIIHTGIIPLYQYESFSSYLSTIRSSRRQDYKKSNKLNLGLSRKHSISDFIKLYVSTFDRQGVNVSAPEIEYLTNFLASLLNSGIAKMLSATDHNGVIYSSVVILTDGLSDYYLFGATNPELRSSGANTFLLLEAIKESFSNNIKYFDMVGINSPKRGDFKTSFNSHPLTFFSVKINNADDSTSKKAGG